MAAKFFRKTVTEQDSFGNVSHTATETVPFADGQAVIRDADSGKNRDVTGVSAGSNRYDIDYKGGRSVSLEMTDRK